MSLDPDERIPMSLTRWQWSDIAMSVMMAARADYNFGHKVSAIKQMRRAAAISRMIGYTQAADAYSELADRYEASIKQMERAE